MNLLTLKKLAENLEPKIEGYRVDYTLYPKFEEYNSILNDIIQETTAQSIHKQTFKVDSYAIYYTYKLVNFILVRP